MGFWTDWLDPDVGPDVKGKWGNRKAREVWPAPPGSDARSKLDKLSGVPQGRDVHCGVCSRPANRCKCDKDLGRPRKWYE